MTTFYKGQLIEAFECAYQSNFLIDGFKLKSAKQTHYHISHNNSYLFRRLRP